MSEIIYKRCPSCGDTRVNTEFYKSKCNYDGLHYQCKSCAREVTAKWRTENPGRANTWHKSNPEKVGFFQIKIKYGISQDQYNVLFERQSGCCAICKTHQRTLHRKLAVDHDHHTGKVRGLLCAKCNCGLGNFNDNLNVLMKAALYLEANDFVNLRHK
jgi:hypothetical protein